MINQKQLENMEYFNCLGSMVTNDARCTREIKSRIAMAKVAFSRKKTLFTSKLDLNLSAAFRAQRCLVLKLGHFGKQSRNTWKVLKFGAGEDELD
jgi:hypothetical protein